MIGDKRAGIREPLDPHIEGLEDGVREDGNITFHVTTPEGKDLQMLKLAADGDIYVRGEKVENDIEVVKAFTAWLKQAFALGEKS